MPLKNYGVLKGSVIDRTLASGSNPHYQIHVVDDTTDYRIAVNVQSQDGSQVEYLVVSHFEHPISEGLRELERGYRKLTGSPNPLALDYIRSNVADPRSFIPLPMAAPGPDNDLNEKLDHFVQRAMSDEEAEIYAFGEKWGPENKKDKVFGFLPGNGIHDIHMNQGNPSGQFAGDNGVFQDGGLLFYFPSAKQWVAVFLKFQTQSWHTNDKTGNVLSVDTSGPPSDTAPQPPLGPHVPPTVDRPDGLIRIVGARVNDVKTPEVETVTLLNTSPVEIDLSGWALIDKAESVMPLRGKLGGGEAKTLRVEAPVVLSNKGGTITLVNADGLKVDGVSYTKEAASRPGWTVVF
ncbi:MAG: DUF2278 family protein [Myxococcales bacterium]